MLQIWYASAGWIRACRPRTAGRDESTRSHAVHRHLPAARRQHDRTPTGITHTHAHTHARTHTRAFNGPFSGVSRYQKGKTNLDFTEARDSEWQWHQLGYTQVCISLHTDNHTSTPRLKFFTGRMPFLPPNQQRESTEGTTGISYRNTIRSNPSHCSLSFFLHG